MRLLLVLSIAMIFAGSAAAENTRSREACRADYQRLCHGVKPGDGRIRGCFKAHRGEISPACRAVLQQRRASAKAK